MEYPTQSYNRYFQPAFSAILKKYDAFFAFNDEQRKQKKEDVPYLSLPSGLYIPKANVAAYMMEWVDIAEQAKKDLLKAHTMEEVVLYELINTEYMVSGNWVDAWERLFGYGFTKEELRPAFREVLKKLDGRTPNLP